MDRVDSFNLSKNQNGENDGYQKNVANQNINEPNNILFNIINDTSNNVHLLGSPQEVNSRQIIVTIESSLQSKQCKDKTSKISILLSSKS